MADFVKTPVKGMCDMLPADMRLREYVLGMIKSVYARYGFMQIETPVMEHIENLTSKQGGDNEKLIFKVMKRGRDLEKAVKALAESAGSLPEGEKIRGEYIDALADNGLRYDLTVPLARYYANNSQSLPVPFKALQTGSVWRADNPQKGRFRQFTQCDIDILGDESNLAEIELVGATSNMLSLIFRQAGISGFTVRINDRRILSGVALASGFKEEDIPEVLISLDKSDKIGRDGVRKELVENGFDEGAVDSYLGFYDRGADSVSAFCSGIDSSFLDPKVVSSLEEIMACADRQTDDSVRICFDPTLVRGMGYYTGPIFEVSIDGYGFSIAGGGRYDRMIGRFSGQETPACGFSIGFERIITILSDRLKEAEKEGEDSPAASLKAVCSLPAGSVAFLIHKDVATEEKLSIMEEAKKLREEGLTVTVQPMKKNLGAQMGRLEQEGYTDFRKVYKD